MCVVDPSVHPPPLQLPLDVYVVLHSGEHRSKSTSLPASLISPMVHIVSYPSVPDLDRETTLVLYPSPQAVDVSQIPDVSKYRSVVFIDSTWQQSTAIVSDERIKKFVHVKIQHRESLFWRYQDFDPSYLATVEAMYYFLLEFVTRAKGKYSGEVDDLMYYYINQYITIQDSYSARPKEKLEAEDSAAPQQAGGEERTFTWRHWADYVLKGVAWKDVAAPPAAAAAEKPAEKSHPEE